MTGWYVRAREDADVQGPFAENAVQRYIRQGRVRPDMWFSTDNMTWRQRPTELFPPAVPLASVAPPRSPKAAAPAPGPRRARRRGPAPEREGRPRSNAAGASLWAAAGVTVFLLLMAMVLDQWASARVQGSRGPTLGLHFGRTSVALAAESIELSRPVKIGDVAYAEVAAGLPDPERIVLDQIQGYASILTIVLLLACLLRLAGSVLVARARAFTGPPAFTYVAGTVVVASVFVVALLFNGSSLVQAVSITVSRHPEADVQAGWGISTWAAMAALIVDAGGILAIHTLSKARQPSTPRRRR